MAIPAMALLQQHDARRDIVIEPARGVVLRSKPGGIPNWERSELGAQLGRKNQPVCLSVCVSDRHFYPSTLTDFDETWPQGPYSDLVWPQMDRATPF